MYEAIALALLSAIEKLSEAYQRNREAALQSKEWTDEQAVAFDNRMEDALASEAWKTDEERGK